MKQIHLLLAFLFFVSGTAQADVFQRMLCAVFGGQPVSPHIQQSLDRTNEILGTDTAGYAMNSRAKMLGLGSFTWAGATWFDEDVLKDVPDDVLLFATTHEVSHDIYWHGAKRAAAVAACIAIPSVFASSPIRKIGGPVIWLLLGFPYFSRMFERDADLLAAHTLCAAGEKQSVQAYCDFVDFAGGERSEQGSCYLPWRLFPSIRAQVRYLKAVLATCVNEVGNEDNSLN
jgi:hypothetical protein